MISHGGLLVGRLQQSSSSTFPPYRVGFVVLDVGGPRVHECAMGCRHSTFPGE